MTETCTFFGQDLPFTRRWQTTETEQLSWFKRLILRKKPRAWIVNNYQLANYRDVLYLALGCSIKTPFGGGYIDRIDFAAGTFGVPFRKEALR